VNWMAALRGTDLTNIAESVLVRSCVSMWKVLNQSSLA